MNKLPEIKRDNCTSEYSFFAKKIFSGKEVLCIILKKTRSKGPADCKLELILKNLRQNYKNIQTDMKQYRQPESKHYSTLRVEYGRNGSARAA